jgi:hypothetical protein
MALLVALVALVAAGKAVLYDTVDPDCFLHLLAADQLLADGVGPLVDRQSFASIPQAWPPYSWLAEIGMKLVWDNGGYRASIAVHAIMAAALMAVIGAACVVKAPHPFYGEEEGLPDPDDHDTARPTTIPPPVSRLSAVLATACAAFLSLPYLSFRPVTAALVLLSACYLLLLRDRRLAERSRAVWLVIPITVLTVNIHLFAVATPVFVGCLFLGALWERRASFDPPDWPEADRRAGRYAALLAGSMLACLATPMIRAVPGAFVHMQTDPIVASPVIAEYQPFYRGALGVVAAGIVGLILVCAYLNRRRLRAGEIILLVVVLGLLMRMGRFAPLFALGAAPILATVLPRFSERLLGRLPVRVMVSLALIAGAWRIGAAFPHPTTSLEWWVNRQGPDAPGYPTDAAQYVDEHVRPVSGRLINEITWGGYLEWRFGDRFQTLLDGRTQCFSPELWRLTYLSGHLARKDFLSRVHADAAVLPVDKSVFHDALVELGWTQVYADERAEVLIPPSGNAKRDAARDESGVEAAARIWTEALFGE